jgi:hypothetical protein
MSCDDCTAVGEENARLKSDLEGERKHSVKRMRERDEARANAANMEHVATEAEGRCVDIMRQRDEARAACAAKGVLFCRAVDLLYGTVRPEFAASPSERTQAPRIRAFLDELEGSGLADGSEAVPSTAGAELLAELKALREDHTDSEKGLHDMVLDLQARLEKAEAECSHCKIGKQEHASLQAQLEALRSALQSYVNQTQYSDEEELERQGRAALLPSAPRLYRNAALEEAARVVGVWGDLQGVANQIRALKDTETFTGNRDFDPVLRVPAKAPEDGK